MDKMMTSEITYLKGDATALSTKGTKTIAQHGIGNEGKS